MVQGSEAEAAIRLQQLLRLLSSPGNPPAAASVSRQHAPKLQGAHPSRQLGLMLIDSNVLAVPASAALAVEDRQQQQLQDGSHGRSNTGPLEGQRSGKVAERQQLSSKSCEELFAATNSCILGRKAAPLTPEPSQSAAVGTARLVPG